MGRESRHSIRIAFFCLFVQLTRIHNRNTGYRIIETSYITMVLGCNPERQATRQETRDEYATIYNKGRGQQRFDPNKTRNKGGEPRKRLPNSTRREMANQKNHGSNKSAYPSGGKRASDKDHSSDDEGSENENEAGSSNDNDSSGSDVPPPP